MADLRQPLALGRGRATLPARGPEAPGRRRIRRRDWGGHRRAPLGGERPTSGEPNTDLQLEIAHLLLIDIVGYSKLLVNEQVEVQQQLKQIVRTTGLIDPKVTVKPLKGQIDDLISTLSQLQPTPQHTDAGLQTATTGGGS